MGLGVIFFHERLFVIAAPRFQLSTRDPEEVCHQYYKSIDIIIIKRKDTIHDTSKYYISQKRRTAKYLPTPAASQEEDPLKLNS